MDDFGAGYSSLTYLLSFPFNKIKIDQRFIAGLPDRRESPAIVRAVADLARDLNIRVVAEGVETMEQKEEARKLGRAAFRAISLAFRFLRIRFAAYFGCMR